MIESKIINNITYMLYDYWIEKTHPLSVNYYFFSGGPGILATIMLLWLIFVTKIGPNLMKNRKPFVLREILIVYNLILVLINIYFVYCSIKWLDFGRKILDTTFINPLDIVITDEVIVEINEKYLYFCSKVFDLFDTIFFVLRKKSNQITILHVYHHFMGTYYKM